MILFSHEREVLNMSNKERAIELLNQVPDYKMGYVLAYIQGITADEEADDIFCERMVENYKNAPDEDKEGIPLEECLKIWGLEDV
jgi:hypothetical protein